jgi:histidinol-phosphate aminotransferase
LERELRTLGLEYWSSRANFVLVRVGPAHTEFIQALRTRGILVRDRNSDPGCEGCVRLTVGSGKDVRTLIDALRGMIETINKRREVRV